MPQVLKKKSAPKAKSALKSDDIVVTATEQKRKLAASLGKLTNRDKLEIMRDMGLGTKYFTCYKCGNVLSKDKFYTTTDITITTGITPICKQCAMDIAMPMDEKTGERVSPTMDSCKDALYYMNRVWLDSIWQDSLLEAANESLAKGKNNVFTALVKNSILPHNANLTWRDGEEYNSNNILSLTKQDSLEGQNPDVILEFEKNKIDAIRLLGYEPFAKEALEDQPFLYAQLVGYLDMSGEANQDMMRISSIITIVRGFLQQARYDDLIATYMNDIPNLKANMPTIKTLQSMKKELTDTINKLAESSCISLKHSKNNTKGENTWTGKIRKLKEINLREAEVNGFDIDTCRGMRQVMDMSNASILQQIKLDENDYTEMLAEQRILITNLQRELASYKEVARIVLRENIDIRDTLKESELLDEKSLIDLDELYSRFRDASQESDNHLDDKADDENEGDDIE